MRVVLLADDDPGIRTAVGRLLGRSGYQPLLAADGVEALQKFRAGKPALVILDVMMPRCDGPTVLTRIRKESRVPVLMLSGRSGLDDKVRGLDLGADDYLTKPFLAPELLARVRALLRRVEAQEPDVHSLSAGGLVLNVGSREAEAGGRSVRLTPIEFRILESLMQRPQLVFTREMLLDRIDANQEKAVTDRAVDASIVRLRRKLSQLTGQEVIETIRGFGYRLAGASAQPMKQESGSG